MTNILPPEFEQTIREVYGPAGETWLCDLPALVDECRWRWSLEIGEPYPLSYNYVVRVARQDGSPAVLKLGVPNPELTSEIAALHFYAGQGIAQIYASDAEEGILLIEQLDPGVTLADLEDDDHETTIAAGIMRELWRPAPAGYPFLSVVKWAKGIQRLRRCFDGGSGPLPPALLDQAERNFADLLGSAGAPVLLHGDLHHFNILKAGRAPWLAIDPKGVLGEPAYEIGAFLYNPLPDFPNRLDLRRALARRIDRFCESLDLERQRVVGYGLAQAVLSACWSVEDHGYGWEPFIAVAEQLAAL
jgi:streptomycin 6-kinase